MILGFNPVYKRFSQSTMTDIVLIFWADFEDAQRTSLCIFLKSKKFLSCLFHFTLCVIETIPSKITCVKSDSVGPDKFWEDC